MFLNLWIKGVSTAASSGTFSALIAPLTSATCVVSSAAASVDGPSAHPAASSLPMAEDVESAPDPEPGWLLAKRGKTASGSKMELSSCLEAQARATKEMQRWQQNTFVEGKGRRE